MPKYKAYKNVPHSDIAHATRKKKDHWEVKSSIDGATRICSDNVFYGMIHKSVKLEDHKA